MRTQHASKAFAKLSWAGWPNAAWTFATSRKNPADISPLGHARQELAVRQGIEGAKAKEITQAVKALGLKVQSALQDGQIRVSGAKKDDLQRVIAALRARDFGVALGFKNFRD
ncbi:MAG: DUF520 family protein [Terrimicrobiaceae bacterium]|nr:DUF520 family protein [Terrimicrobiaceae bacterium]